MSLSEQDRDELAMALAAQWDQLTADPTHAWEVTDAEVVDSLTPSFEALITHYVNAALTEAAERLTSHCNTAAADIQGDDDVETVMAAKTYDHAARIVRDLRT